MFVVIPGTCPDGLISWVLQLLLNIFMCFLVYVHSQRPLNDPPTDETKYAINLAKAVEAQYKGAGYLP